MAWHVNENCIGCGLCPSIAPDTFEMTDAGVARVTAQPTAGQEGPAREAKDSCPVAAIEEN